MISYSNCSAYYSVNTPSNVLHGCQAYVLNALCETIRSTHSFPIHRKMPILILLSESCQSSPLARHSRCSCIGPQSIWPLPFKFPFAFAGYKTGASFSLPCTFPLHIFLPITLLHRDPDHCNSSTPSISSASPAVCIGSSCLKKVWVHRSRAALTLGTVRSIPTKTRLRITLVKSCLSYFHLALSRDGSSAYASTNPPTAELEKHVRTKSTSCLHSSTLGGRALPAKRH